MFLPVCAMLYYRILCSGRIVKILLVAMHFDTSPPSKMHTHWYGATVWSFIHILCGYLPRNRDEPWDNLMVIIHALFHNGIHRYMKYVTKVMSHW